MEHHVHAPKPTMKDKVKHEIFITIVILVGVGIVTFSTVSFILPYDIMVGGSTGLGLIVRFFTKAIPLSYLVLFFNVILLILARFMLGRRYAASIVLGSLSYPVYLDIFTRMGFTETRLFDDPLLASITGGIICGVGLGIILRAGRSMGGSDVLPLILFKKMKLPVGPTMYIQDTIILILQVFNSDLTHLIYAIIFVYGYSMVAQKILLLGSGNVQFQIYSDNAPRVLKALLDKGIGATLLHGTSGYENKEIDVINSVTTMNDMNRVKHLILDVDPGAFVTISIVHEVSGLGFSYSDEDKPKKVRNEGK